MIGPKPHRWRGGRVGAPLTLVGACALGTATAACAPPSDLGGTPEVIVDAEPAVIVSTASALLSSVADLAVAPDGLLYLLDPLASVVHVIDSLGRPVRDIGRPGQGPGELSRPGALRLIGDTLLVTDPGNGRLQRYGLDGADYGSIPMPTGGATAALGPSGGFVKPMLGFRETLAIAYDADGRERIGVGELLAPPQEMVDMTALLEQARAGEMPGLLLNSARAMVAGDGTILLSIPAVGRISRFGIDGAHLWSIDLEEPGFEAIHQEWLQRVDTIAIPAVPTLSYLWFIREVGNEYWVLLDGRVTGDTRFVALAADGTVARRITLPGVGGVLNFVADPDSGFLYLYRVDSAELLRLPLP